MLEIPGMHSNPSLPLLSGPLWIGVLVPVKVLFVDQIELFDLYTDCKKCLTELLKIKLFDYLTILIEMTNV